MDLKTGRAKKVKVQDLEKSVRANVRRSNDTLSVDTRVVEINMNLSGEGIVDNTWYTRAQGEAGKNLTTSANLGTGALPVFDFAGVNNAIAIGDALISRRATIKDAQCVCVQQGSSADRVIEIFVGYVSFTPGSAITMTDLNGITQIGAVQTITAAKSWKLSSENFTGLNGLVLPKNTVLILAYRCVSGPTNPCGFQLKFDLEYKN